MRQKLVGRFGVNSTGDIFIYFLIFFFLVGSLFGLYVSTIAHEAAKYVLSDEVAIYRSYFAFILCGISQPLFVCFLGASVFGCFVLPLFAAFKGFFVSFSAYFIFALSHPLISADLFSHIFLIFVSCLLFIFFCSKAFKTSLGLLKNLFFKENTHNRNFLLDYFKCSGFVLVCFIIIITLKYIIIFR